MSKENMTNEDDDMFYGNNWSHDYEQPEIKNNKQREFVHEESPLEDLRECEQQYNEGLWC